jgi:tRNA pseudouridine55 synthase
LYSGFLNIHKPLGITSHDVVARVRRVYQRDTGSKKVGHAGTLDPLAEGVLIVCVGSATRLSDYVMHSTKQYRATLKLGEVTDTYDAEGRVIAKTDAQHITAQDVQAVLSPFIGDIQQVPPMYSAIKKDGKKLYELAREGETIALEARPIHIDSIELTRFENSSVELLVTCGAGTYIRSLAYDIGQALGVGAHLTHLVRVASGTFHINNAIMLENLLQDPAWTRHITAPQQALTQFPALTLDETQIQALQYGRSFRNLMAIVGETIMGYAPSGELLAILRSDDDWLRPYKVFLHDTH